MKIELVVFDLAGTTVKDNKDVHKVLKKALSEHDVEISIAEANSVMGLPKPIAIRKLLNLRYPHSILITDDWIQSIHQSFTASMIEFYTTSKTVGEKEGASKTFETLRKHGIKIAVDTGFDRRITNALLKRMRWEERNLIDVSVTSDEVLNGRPFPDLIFKAMELTHVSDASKVAKVGDTASDLAEGTSAGCGYVIGITSGAFLKEQLIRENHTHLISEIPELLNIIPLE